MLTFDFVCDNITAGGDEIMFYSTDCNFIVKVMKTDIHYECYTKEQVMSHINQPTGTIIYKVLRDGSLKRLGAVKPNTEIFVKI